MLSGANFAITNLLYLDPSQNPAVAKRQKDLPDFIHPHFGSSGMERRQILGEMNHPKAQKNWRSSLNKICSVGSEYYVFLILFSIDKNEE